MINSERFYKWIFDTDPKRWDAKQTQPVDIELKSLLVPYENKQIKLLEIGCGNGRTIKYIKRPEWDITGIDFIKRAIEVAKEKNPDTKFLLENAQNIYLPDAQFDVIYSLGVYEHIENPNFNEPKRLLKENGKFICLVPIDETNSGLQKVPFCIEPDRWDHSTEWLLSCEIWRKRLENAGFIIESYKEGFFICK